MSKTHVPLDQIEDSPHQVRIDTGDLKGLAQSILANGLRQLPEGRLMVDGEPPGSYTPYTHHEDGKWWLDDGAAQLASGHRRAAAIQLLNDDETVTDAQLEGAGLVPGHVQVDLQRLSDKEMLDLGTIENVDREGLSPIEEARQIQEHVDFGRSGQEIAERFGKSPSWVSNRKRLTELPQRVQTAIHEGGLTVREGQALIKAFGLPDEHPGAYAKVTRQEIKPGAIFEAAVEGEIDSDGIRERAGELEQVIERIKRATHDMPGADEGEMAGPEPTVGTTHSEAVGPSYPNKETTPDTDEQELTPEQHDSEESDTHRPEPTGSESSADGHGGDDGRGPSGLHRDAEEAEGVDEGAVDEEQPGKSAGAGGGVSGDGAPADVKGAGEPTKTVDPQPVDHERKRAAHETPLGTSHPEAPIDNDSVPGTFYLLRLKDRLKFGITEDLDRRLKQYVSHGGYTPEILRAHKCGTRSLALLAERRFVSVAESLGIDFGEGRETIKDSEFAVEVFDRFASTANYLSFEHGGDELATSDVGHVDPDGAAGAPWSSLVATIRRALARKRTFPSVGRPDVDYLDLRFTNPAPRSADWGDYYRYDVDVLFRGYEDLPG